MDHRDTTAERRKVGWAFILFILCIPVSALASDLDEFKAKREAVFEFAQKPVVVREGDKVSVAFETKGLCDVTVAIEDANGRIVRHLASGVLGPNAPEPFQKNAKKQTIVWDGKSDQGVYVDDKEKCTVRVSLGLKPQLERTLFWSPHKRLTNGKAIDGDAARVCPRPDGVYVAEGSGGDSLRLFDHDGNYLRTVYPFPAGKLKDVQGLEWATFPQDGASLPVRRGMMHATFFTSGSSAEPENKYGHAAQALAVHGERMAVAFRGLNRLGTDGSSGGLPFDGPALGHPVKIGVEDMWDRGKPRIAGTRSIAFSPDGKWLYVSGFGWCGTLGRAHEWLSGVTRMEFARNDPPTLFLGSVKQGVHGKGPREFNWATSVACDPQGRVYVTDHLNDRVQVFTADGELVKSIPVRRPAVVQVHQKTGEIYVFSWRLGSDWWDVCPGVKPVLTHLGPLDDPRVLATHPLPFLREYDLARGGSSRLTGGGFEYQVALDSWSAVPTFWLFPGKGEPGLIFTEVGGKLSVKRDFAKDIAATVVRVEPPIIQRQRLYVNPVDGMLYVGEADSGVMKSFKQLVGIDPATGAVGLVELPYTAEDLAIDLNGQFYLRTDVAVGRYDPKTWKEVPFDYGEEMPRVGFDVAVRGAPLVGGLFLPANGRPSWWHQGGISVSPSGHVAVTCHNPRELLHRVDGTQPISPDTDLKRGYDPKGGVGRVYKPTLYPGRAIAWQVHIYDQFGHVHREDAFPGVDRMDGIGLDKDDNLYVLAHQNRAHDGKPYFIGTSSTLMKVKPRAAKIITGSDRVPLPLDRDARPKRNPDLAGAWVEDVDWMYGGVGLNNMACICWNARPTLDLFARSFAPELDHFSVAVLDANGNLILRVGRYGNVDDGVPLFSRDPKGSAALPRSIGGDELALVFPAYLATHTDRRLFIADAGNSRIASVKLGYHTEEKIALKDVADGK